MHIIPPDDESYLLMASGHWLPNAVFNTPRFKRLSLRARCLMYGLYEIADAEGRTTGNAIMLRDMLCPTDSEMSSKRIDAALTELRDADMIFWYIADGRRTVQLPRYRDLQPSSLHLERAAPSRFPPPPATLASVTDVILGTKTAIDPAGLALGDFEKRSGPQVLVGPDLSPEFSPDDGSSVRPPSPSQTLPYPPEQVFGEEELFTLEEQKQRLLSPPIVPLSQRTNREKLLTVKQAVRHVRQLRGAEMLEGLKIMLSNAAPETYAPVRREDEEAAFAAIWFGYWMARVGDPDDLLDDNREGLIRRRYVECGRDGDLMLFAIDGCAKDHFRMGRDPRKGDDPRLRAVRSLLKSFEVLQELAKKGGWKPGKIHKVRAKLQAAFGT